MSAWRMVAFGWLVPGGAYLMMRRYLQFAVYAVLVTAALAGGLALHGGCGWPQAGELAGLDTFTGWVFQAGALAKLFAGVPYPAAWALHGSGSLLDGRVHEYGTTLLMMAGLINALAVAGALDLRKAAS